MRFVAIVALPLIAAVAQLIENVIHEQELRFGRGGPARDQWSPVNVADLDHAIDRVDAHQGLASRHLTADLVDDGEEKRVCATLGLFNPSQEVLAASRGILVEPSELGVGAWDCRGRKEAVPVRGGAEGFKPRITPLKHHTLRVRAGLPISKVLRQGSFPLGSICSKQPYQRSITNIGFRMNFRSPACNHHSARSAEGWQSFRHPW